MKKNKFKKKILKIAHIIPMMNYGGVEVAIQKSYRDLNKKFEYKVFTIKKTGFPNINQKSFIFLIYVFLCLFLVFFLMIVHF